MTQSGPDLETSQGGVGRLLPGAALTPPWLQTLVDAATHRPWPGLLAGVAATGRTARHSAVLMAIADAADGGEGGAIDENPAAAADPELLLVGRASTLRAHGGQPAFPGGRSEPGESPVQTALREAVEETGIDSAGVRPLVLFDELDLTFSGHRVRPVLAHWFSPSPVGVVDSAETASVHRIPIRDLADPGHRGTVRLSSGFAGPAFDVDGLIVWGFTGLLVDALLELGGWAQPWDERRSLTLPDTDAGRVFGSALPVRGPA